MVLGDLFRALNMTFFTRSLRSLAMTIIFNTRNKSGISAHSCIILYIMCVHLVFGSILKHI